MRIRKLFVEVTTKWVGEAKLKAVKVAGDAAAATLRQLSDVADGVAGRSERAAKALADVARAARSVGTSLSGGSGGSTRRSNPEAAAARTAEQGRRNEEVRQRRVAREEERQQREANRRTRTRPAGGGSQRPAADPLDSIVKASAAQGGLEVGSIAITSATKALGPLASASDKAKARISDLTAQVERNRKEMAALKAQAIQTGDADGTLAKRMQGLSVATLDATTKLSGARRELRGIDGGLLGAIKSASVFSGGMAGLVSVAGSFVAQGLERVISGIAAGFASAVTQAMDFQTAFVGVAKVARGLDATPVGLAKIDAGIKATSRSLGVMPDQVADLAAQLTAAFSDVKENDVAVDVAALTSDVTKIGGAWKVSGKQAGEFFAETSRGLGTTTTETKSLFGSINELGNKIGIDSAKIAEGLQKSAGVIKAAHLSGETGAALNATLIAAGASAEVAATGVRTFVTRLSAGETEGQVKAFAALGLSMEKVRKELTSGDVGKAEAQIRAVVKAIGGLDNDKQLETLTELFGTESLGSIGAAATAAKKLGESFDIAGDKAAAAVSVQKEFDVVTSTSAAGVDKLKANIAVLAIEVGNALLPHIDKITKFLTSEAGQEWGRQAVEKVSTAIGNFAEKLGKVWDIGTKVSTVFDKLSAVFGFLQGGIIGTSGALDIFNESLDGAFKLAQGLGDAFAALGEGRVKDAIIGLGKALLDGILEPLRILVRQVINLADAIPGVNIVPDALREFAGMGAKKIDGQDDIKEDAGGMRQGPTIPDMPAPAPSTGAGAGAVSGGVNSRERFDELAAKVRAGTGLRESERKELKSLTKELDEVRPTKAKKGRKKSDGWNEEQRKIAAEARYLHSGALAGVIDDEKLAANTAQRLGNAGSFKENFRLKNLAAAGGNPDLARLLEQGRATNDKGKLGGPTNELDKMIEDKIVNGPSALTNLGGRGADAVAGPAISTKYEYHQQAHINLGGITVEPVGDTSPERIRSAGRQVADAVVTGWKEAAIVFGNS